MKKYFTNPELKRSSIFLVILMSTFFLITIFALKLQHDRLKQSYIKSLGAIAIKIIEKDPQLEKDIIPLILNKASEEEKVKGEEFLRKYGITKELDTVIFPYISKTSTENYYLICFIFIAMLLMILTVNYFNHTFFYKRIRRITTGAKRVIEGEYDIAISEDKEGDFSKLAIAFNSMKEIIRSNLHNLKREKQFLVDLLADISHQLKTPLSSMILYNEIMLSKELSNDQRTTFLVNNKNQLHRMECLIKSMLKLAKIDAKAVEFHKENYSLNETIHEAVEALESMSNEKGIKVKFHEEEVMIFNHDALWLQEALINIIKNGIEHSEQGKEVSVSLIENPVYRRVIIEDNGEGISEEDLPNIFKRFYKAKESKNTNSVGIGLALAKSIIEAHGGIIEAQSTLGVCTRFIITFLKY
ncbi:sensor histidine kinase [Clostridium sp. UBA4548]|uniref:sensor histidine kinase n=1 Tax=Clostridium sp. UBA4548 TaxID=1946361 RepID=UPI0025BF789C|nr:HAMP domain-containing sensor histidine kinase [Clostridium sp. UBA4548]